MKSKFKTRMEDVLLVGVATTLLAIPTSSWHDTFECTVAKIQEIVSGACPVSRILRQAARKGSNLEPAARFQADATRIATPANGIPIVNGNGCGGSSAARLMMKRLTRPDFVQ